jgi:hypothetical protein
MTVTNFRTLKADIVDRTILSTDYFAEEVEYVPSNGTARTITVKISAKVELQEPNEGDERFEEMVRVKVKRDATDGIGSPELGDMITRSVTREPDRRPYVFTGHKEEVSESHWVLIFGRILDTGRSPAG